MYVSSRNSHSIKQFDFPSGKYINDIVTGGSGGLSYPQEVLLHHEGFLLVTGRGNSSIKKYSTDNGAFLGNFTNGYVLDNPTKTTIRNDSLLYVSQWGIAKNKVVRFRIDDGSFVDEFTSVGMHNPCGHAWDSEGNLFVAQYANGYDGSILQFDTEGELIGTFITAGVIKGPVNIWFNTSDNTLSVADWTLGEILVFDGETGEYLKTMVSGFKNLEGYIYDKNGNLYLCDWTANRIYKYNTVLDDLTLFTDEGNLMSPNSICLKEDNSTRIEEMNGTETHIYAYPTIFHTYTIINVNIKISGYHKIMIRNLAGEIVCTICSNFLEEGNYEFVWSGENESHGIVPSGVYFVEILSKNGRSVVSLIKE